MTHLDDANSAGLYDLLHGYLAGVHKTIWRTEVIFVGRIYLLSYSVSCQLDIFFGYSLDPTVYD